MSASGCKFGYENSIGCVPLGERKFSPSALDKKYSKAEHDQIVNFGIDEYIPRVKEAQKNASNVQVRTMSHEEFLAASNTLIKLTSKRLKQEPAPDIQTLFIKPGDLGMKGFLPKELAEAFQFDILGEQYLPRCTIS